MANSDTLLYLFKKSGDFSSVSSGSVVWGRPCLVSEMNGGISDRQAGIDMAFIDHQRNPNIKYPNLTETLYWEWIDKEPEHCSDQGFFYDNDEDDEE